MPQSERSSEHSESVATPRTGMLFGVVILVSALVALVGASLALGGYGQARRFVPADSAIVKVGTSGEVDAALRSRGVHGAAMVVATSQLGYAPVSIVTTPSLLDWPVARTDLSRYFVQRTSRASWVWVLARTGVARTVIYLLPSASLSRFVSEGRRLGYPGISDDGRSIVANDEGYLRTISDGLPGVPEQPVLVVDASYFEDGTAASLIDQLRVGGLRPSLVIMYAARDQTDLSETARNRYETAIPQLGTFLQEGRR